MLKWFGLFGISFMFLGTQTACISKRVVGTEIKTENRVSQVLETERIATFTVKPNTAQSQTKDGVAVSVVYTRPMSKEDAKCMDQTWNCVKPKSLFFFQIKNESDDIRTVKPMFIFESKSLLEIDHRNMSCADFDEFMPANEVEVAQGEEYVLRCAKSSSRGQGSLAATPANPVTATSMVTLDNLKEIRKAQVDRMKILAANQASASSQGGPITLYPGQSKNGLILASHPSEQANGRPTANTIINGDFTVFTEGDGRDRANSVIKIPYEFIPTTVDQEVAFDLFETQQYTVERIEELFKLFAILPVFQWNIYNQRVDGSEEIIDTVKKCADTP